MKLEIVRPDLNDKVIVKAREYLDAEAAVGEYVSILMLAGILKMSHAGLTVVPAGDGAYRLANGWTICVRAAL